jgi:23S rRNA (pseudouridine1915-N3)-methyltransferase
LFTIKIISIGNKQDKNLSILVDNYSKKLGAQLVIKSIDLKPEKKFNSVKQKKELEALRINSNIDSSFVIAMDEKGKLFDSKEFASKIAKWKENFSGLTFVIGGADGLDKSILNKANIILSFSRMTLPHQLIKLFLVEQIYRSSTILSNHPYHRE